MDNNIAMRFFGRGFGNSDVHVMSAVPPAKRGLIYDVMRILDGPLARSKNAFKENPVLDPKSLIIARVLKNYDRFEALRSENQLTRARLIEMLFGDFGVQPDANNKRINDAYLNKLQVFLPNRMASMQAMLDMTGATIDECLAALQEGRRLEFAPYIAPVSISDSLQLVDGKIDNALSAFRNDICRPLNATRSSDNSSAPADDKVRFTFSFPDGLSA